MNKWFLNTALCLSAGLAIAATPGKVLKMVPQSGIDKSFKIVTEGEIELTVQFYTPEIFRIMAAPQRKDADGKISVCYDDPKNDPQKAQILIGANADRSQVIFADNKAANTYTFKTSALTLTLNKADCTFSACNYLGQPIFSEAKPLDLTEKATTQTLATTKNEFFYGGGQQNGYLSHKGRKIDILADGNWEEGGHPNPAPWYMTNTGYGVLRNTFSIGHYDFSNPTVVTTTHDENRFDAFYFVGGNFDNTLDLYTSVTGRPNFIPMWGLELGDADAYMTRDPKTKEPAQLEDGAYKEITPDVISRVAEKYRAANMPGGWLLVNDGYGCGHMQLGYVVKSLQALGFRTGLWTEGALNLINWEVGTAGTRVQKIDVAWSGPAYQHALQCNKIAFDGIEDNSDARAFVWTVQGWAGTQRYGICWTGDQSGNWDLIRYHIPTLTGSSMSGQAYATTDVDGIFGGSPETYLRDLQWKCYTPAMYVMNGWSHVNKGPWSYAEPYQTEIRKALFKKMRMVPYFYAYMRNAYDTGAPIVRPLVWNFPNDPKTWGEETKYEFMLGHDFLVAPVYTSLKLNKGWYKHGIYLPGGLWIDANDGRRVAGPTTLAAYPIDLTKIPVFIRAGAIIPMYPEMLSMGEKRPDPLTLDIYPWGESSFTLYEDDGETRAYQQGEFSTQTITCSAPQNGTSGDIDINVAAAEGIFKGMLEDRIYTFTIRTQMKPTAVFVDGDEILAISDTTNAATIYKNSRQTWYYDAEDMYGTLHVKLHRRTVRQGFNLHVRIDPTVAIVATPAYPVPEITNELDKQDFTYTTTSEQRGAPLKNAFDGSEETMWHSCYSQSTTQATNFPYTIDIDMHQLAALKSATYLPRQDLGNGVIKDYEIYVSRTPNAFGEPVAVGALPAFKKDTKGVVAPATINFPTTWGRYVRLVFKSAQNGQRFATMAELDLQQDQTAAPLPDETQAIGTETLSVDGQPYDRSLLKTVESEQTISLDGTWDKILGHAGMLTGNTNTGNVTFRIFADDVQIFERAGMKPTDVKQLINVDIPATAKSLRLVLTKEANASDKDTGVWTDLRLFRAGSGK